MTITIREAAVGDTTAVAVLFDLYRQFYEQPADLPRATAFIADRIQRNESVILLATDPKAGPVGFCQLYPTFCSVEAQPIYALYDLYVHPLARRSGVGKRCCSPQRAVQDQTARRAWISQRPEPTIKPNNSMSPWDGFAMRFFWPTASV